MTFTRRQFGGLAMAGVAAPTAALAQDRDMLAIQRGPLFAPTTEYREALAFMRERGNPDMAAGLIQSMRFARDRRDAIVETLQAITGAGHGTDWFDWMLWQENTPEVVPHPTFIPFKREVLLRVDENFDDFLRLEYIARDRMKIRLEEITWGGVVKDGIPSVSYTHLTLPTIYSV